MSGGSARSARKRRVDELVGRNAELKSLGAALDDADAGKGQAWFVVGESGIGKTRLVAAVADLAERRGFATAIGHAYPVETGVPYSVFSDALLPILRDIAPSVLTLLTRGASADLAQLFPALEDGRRSTTTTSRGDPAEMKARLLWNFSQFLTRFSAKRPLLLALENLQWADSASLEMLHFAARQVGSSRVLILCTHNDVDQRASASLRATEQSLKSLGAAQRLRLGALTTDDIAALIERRFSASDARARSFAERLHHWTGGNPFFIDETLKALVESGQLSESSGAWSGWEVQTLRVPATIREAVLARLADLSPDARRLAEFAAVLGTRSTHSELSAVSGMSRDAVIAAIDELRSADIVGERAESTQVVYDFTHPLIQETLYAELGLARVRRMHASVADALEHHYGSRALAHAGQLAFHYVRADAGEGDEAASKAMRYLRAAGSDAASKYANREAAQYLASAIELLEQDESAASRQSLIEATGELARVRQRLGDYAGAMALWHRALDAAREAGDIGRGASIERSIGLAHYWRGELNDALAHYDASIDAARRAHDRPLEARVLIARASCLQAIGRTQDSRVETDAALAIATELGDAGLLARAHRAAMLLYLWTGPADIARQHGRRAIAFADESGQRGAAWSANWALAMLGGLTGRAEDARRHLSEAHRIADELGSPLFRAWTSEVEIEYCAGTGDWDRGVAIAEETVEVARALGQRTLLPRVLVWLGLLHIGRGDITRGKACVDEAWSLAHSGDEAGSPRDVFAIVPAHIGRAAYALAVGENAKAIHIGQTGLTIADRSGNVVWAIHRLMPVIAEASLWAADMSRANAIAERMRRESQALGQQLGLAWADACDALVELLSGDRDRAVSLLAGAVDALEAIPYVPDAARLRRQLARALAETGDREGAMRELRRAHDVFQHLGAERELDATREQMRELGARPPARVATEGAAGLTGRELEIVRLVAARRSNKEIGTVLGISSRTASTHLSNIFAKLGVASRGELADHARERGLLED
ncbi:MAG TPA: BREX system ATP-binding domain-containing protein [Gemmatimonadaceae bacterium]